MLTLGPSCNERLAYRFYLTQEYLGVFIHKAPSIHDKSGLILLRLHPQLKGQHLLIAKLMTLQSKITSDRVNQSS